MKYKIKAKLWVWGGGEKGSWYFVSIDPETSSLIEKKFRKFKRGWGSLPVRAEFGIIEKEISKKSKKTKIILETSIFINKKEKNYFTYILPIKKKTRLEIGVQDGDILEFDLFVLKNK